MLLYSKVNVSKNTHYINFRDWLISYI